MKRIVKIAAAVVLGTLVFNVALAQAGDKNHKDNNTNKNSSAKHSEEKNKDFWKDLCYDIEHDCDHCHHGSGCTSSSGTQEYMGGSKNGPPGTPENPTPVNPPHKFYPLNPVVATQLLNNAQTSKLPPRLAGSTIPLKGLGLGNQQIPNIGTGLAGFTGAVGKGVDAGFDAVGDVGVGAAKAVGSVASGVEGAVGDVASGIGSALGDIF